MRALNNYEDDREEAWVTAILTLISIMAIFYVGGLFLIWLLGEMWKWAR
jgi:hypothetical protein